MATVVIVLRFVIRIRPDLVNQGDHAAVNRTVVDAFKLAVNERSRGVTLKTVPHLKNEYNQ
jgi:hypothetical protein